MQYAKKKKKKKKHLNESEDLNLSHHSIIL